MSSTLTRPSRRTATAPPSIVQTPSLQTPSDAPSTSGAAGDESDFAGFVKSIVIGVLIGLPVVLGIITAMVKVAVPEWPIGAIVGIALWVSIWTGMFLGGTITVGLWSHRQHH